MSTTGEELDELDRAVLELESEHWKYRGAKESAIRSRLGLSPVNYYQRLNALISSEAAARHAPMLISRLRRARSRGPLVDTGRVSPDAGRPPRGHPVGRAIVATDSVAPGAPRGARAGPRRARP